MNQEWIEAQALQANLAHAASSVSGCAQRGEKESEKIGAADQPTGDLTDEQIERVWIDLPLTGAYNMGEARLKFARAIEREVAAYLARQSQAAQPSELTDERLAAMFEEATTYPPADEDFAGIRLFAKLIGREHLAGQSQATKVQAVSDLHAAIMNLPCKPGRAIAMHGASKQAYQEGHRDARHAAAELVNESGAAQEVTQQAAPTVEYVPIAVNSHDEAGGSHPNDKTPADPECQKALDARGDDSGQGLDPYWKWGFRAGWHDHKRTAVTQQAAKAETAEQKPEHGSLADNLRIEQTDPGRWVVCVGNWFPDENKARAACRKWKTAYSAAPLVKVMVDRFLGWKLPEDFYPDAGISFDRAYAEKWGMPSGTNLFHAGQAKTMFEHVLAAPTTSTVSAPGSADAKGGV